VNPVSINDFLEYRFLSQLSVSPDGKYAAFLVRHPDEPANRYRSDIWSLNLDTGETRQLTDSGLEGPPTWELDGESILFSSRRGEPGDGARLYRVRPDGGDVQLAYELPHHAMGFCLLADGELLYAARVKPTGPGTPSRGDCVAVEDIPFRHEGRGFSDGSTTRLFLYDPEQQTSREVSEPTLSVQAFTCCEDRIAYTAQSNDDPPGFMNRVWVRDLAAGQAECLSLDGLFVRQLDFMTRESLVLVGSDTETFGVAQNPEVFIADLGSGGLRCLTPGWDRSFANSVQSDCRLGGGAPMTATQHGVYVVTTEGTCSKLVRIDENGDILTIAAPEGSVEEFAVHGETALCIELHADRLQEVYRYDTEGCRRLTSVNEVGLRDRVVSQPEPLRVPSSEDVLDAWVLRPASFDPEAAYPAILMIHGGPRATYGPVISHEMQVLSGLGYAVICGNPRGSSGRGNAFAEIRGRIGTIDYDDIMRTLDAALEACPFIDPERLGVMGGSYGGFMVNWTIGQTDRFKAAVAGRSSSNYITKFLVSDIGFYLNKEMMMTDPWQEGGADKLWRHSPLRYANQVRTPTLFVHGDRDFRCADVEAFQMFTALRYHGVPSRLVVFRGEGHGLPVYGKPANRIRRLEEIRDWFDRHLKQE